MAQSTNSSPKGDSEIDKALLEPLLLPSDPVEEEDLPRARLLGLRRRRRSFLGHSRQPRTKIFKNCIWIFVSIAILVSLGVGIGVAVKRHRRASQHHHTPHYVHRERCLSRAVWTPLEDKPHSAPHCDFPLAASTSFELPRSSDLLYFGAGGSLINTFGHNGIITFTNNPNTSVSPDTIQVDIVASYSSESSFRGVEVCTIKRNGKRNTTGVNFFTSQFWRQNHRQKLFFDINVKLPTPRDGWETPLRFNDLETSLPYFHHYIDDLHATATFNSVSLSSKNSPVEVQSISAKQISIVTNDNHINGTFSTTDNLRLLTQNGFIRVNASLTNNGTSVSRVDMQSFKGPVTANITLLSSADDQAKGSHYNVKAVSWSAPVEVTIPSAPINQTLLMDARTTYSSIQATLPKTFEGLFRVISSSGTSPSVQFRDNVTDPSGMGRHRNTEYFRIKPNDGKGRITWSDDRQDLGFVTLKSDDGSTYLEV